jgi:prepilin-type N-terminal cleavage/methylation domain-containing protein
VGLALDPNDGGNDIREEAQIMSTRRGASLLETLVVLAIIGVLLGLFLPAVQAARRKALETVCKNNLHQLNLAVADFVETNKRLPAPGANGLVGGWTIDVLPYLEQKNLWDHITPGAPIQAAPDSLLRQPRIFRCPIRSGSDIVTSTMMDHANYVLCPSGNRQSYIIIDAPLEVAIPWASGTEMSTSDVIRKTGAHNRGFFSAAGFQNGVNFIPNDQDNR